ncbi:Uu.00g031250.m01.CDS01 [Anthostomella pinea]|uniref:Uu.00g031250.m01.CDS01 n=1 Tax=Anthostomella pinea TaxID=933095 RepID=A0AAI8V8Y5_9PEZI|nr:Uu.00g031250.m01.CDS01 [Anthostomella pinea]
MPASSSNGAETRARDGDGSTATATPSGSRSDPNPFWPIQIAHAEAGSNIIASTPTPYSDASQPLPDSQGSRLIPKDQRQTFLDALGKAAHNVTLDASEMVNHDAVKVNHFMGIIKPHSGYDMEYGWPCWLVLVSGLPSPRLYPNARDEFTEGLIDETKAELSLIDCDQAPERFFRAIKFGDQLDRTGNNYNFDYLGLLKLPHGQLDLLTPAQADASQQ